MSDWVDVAKLEELPPGERCIVDVDDVQIAVFNLDGEYYAIEDVCTHDDGILTGGDVEGDVIVCPRHGARFSIRTGQVLGPPAYEAVDTLPVRVENGVVQVMDDRWE